MLPSYPRLFFTSAYLRTVKVCCQHNDWVGKDIRRVSAGKEGLPGEIAPKHAGATLNIKP